LAHKCFISYHHDRDQNAVKNFVNNFCGRHEVFISRAVGIDQDIVDSNDTDYIMRRIRERHLSDSTVTIVMIGRCTWARKYVDWEIASTLRNDPVNRRSGLVGIQLPDTPDSVQLPPRLAANVQSGYAKYYRYPRNADSLDSIIEDAFSGRISRSSAVTNSLNLFQNNRPC
jgi:hypothetical protein